jgi:hypothetical protein
MATLTNAWADHFYNLVNKGIAPPSLTGGVFLRLFTADPGDGGSFTNEVTGGSYTGQDITAKMSTPTNGSGTTTSAINFSNMPGVTVSHWAKCKSAAAKVDADEMIEHGALNASVILLAGQTFTVAIGDLDSIAN